MQDLHDLRAEALRHMLTNLGPTFIKIGQAVSSRWARGLCPQESVLHASAAPSRVTVAPLSRRCYFMIPKCILSLPSVGVLHVLARVWAC